MRRITFFLALPLIGLVGFLTPILAPAVLHADPASAADANAARQTDVSHVQPADPTAPTPASAVYRRSERSRARISNAARTSPQPPR